MPNESIKRSKYDLTIAHTKEQQRYLLCKLMLEEQDRDLYDTFEPKFS